ncbi:enoyl-CoA hydratase family protein [Virgisporangium ochraceum]|uniref:Enoyl-CoA hydratase n=1 Tax=Virgisporangium ochraceum TaxID=65505 RepID=A0A8J4E9X5_9ACTN|nr:enoyl-CoA hydratase-related protein [Virgisporangium ochraceum]GIJ67720.1 enoyl-CoA hydratase [Virgisporangium ochraceum]
MIRHSVAGGIATITLDSPSNRNALSRQLITDLLAALGVAAADEGTRVIVLTHTGPAFCAGADLKETVAGFSSGQAPGPASPGLRSAGSAATGATREGDAPEDPGPAPAEAGASSRVPAGRMGEVLAALWESPKPVIARVGGAARAGGLGIVAAADIAVCADDVTFAFTEVRIGVIPAVISATVLPRLAPRAAAELFLTGDTFDARRAVEIGLVTAAVPASSLDERVDAYAQALLRGAPAALAGTKELLQSSVRERLASLTDLSVRYFTSDEGREGISALLEKRSPRWVP